MTSIGPPQPRPPSAILVLHRLAQNTGRLTKWSWPARVKLFADARWSVHVGA